MTDQRRKLTAATMFSGIGAPETAMPSWDWIWSAEIERFPAAVLAQRHPESTNLGDVTADDFAERAAIVGRPDVLVFGSPCQDFSVAGRRAGMAGKRGNLSMVALDILGELRPRWFAFENVPGLLSTDEGRGLQWFLRRVDEIGYSLAWRVLDAQFFGLAQRRPRLFAVGHLGDWRGPAAVLLESESMCGDSPPRRKTGEGVAPTIASRPTGGGGLGTDFDCDGGLIAHALRADGFDASEDGTGRGTPLVAFSCKDHGADLSTEIAPTLRSMGHDDSHANAGGQLAVAFNITPSNSNRDYNARPSERSQAITSNGNRPSARGGDLIATSGVRRLTPRECERLQGYRDDYTLITYRGKSAADGPRYKALGNSMPVPVMRWILSRIEVVEAIR